MDRVLLFGAGGMLGRQIANILESRGVTHTSLRHSDLDISDFDALRAAMNKANATLIINAAAFTRVDDCETQPATAMRINGDAVAVMASHAAENGATLVHVSSDYVFEGTGTRPYRETDPTAAPELLSAYGRSKLAGDRAILDSGCRHLIARTSWVYGPGGPNFVDTIARAAAERTSLKVVNDQRGRPTFTVDLAAGIFELLDNGAHGIVNVCNSDECTWHDFACEIVRLVGLQTPVAPCTSAEFPRPAKRPAYSVLDLSRYSELLGREPRSWRDAVASYLSLRTSKA